ncbi:putative TOS1-like glycosyl hydrolase-domain-containing protein [Tricharina praecox]|uniref:putative TOS1-like glycosyl hydrolase-domain-containing protein n=1 Tax=Tricharina praecox TaxID=43433 RepID=UPI00221EAEF3|nr:putative TOS1-like glycosyl hydrolase-domain-containing protein [Tricharina praecox]KAI5844233.1 putative TOS1-like glycosyl hydrolase-domain-containing protein [Tricharina praecox]
MRYCANLLSVVLAFLTAGSTVSAQNYGNGCKTINSISYCEAVQGIAYNDISGSGTYDDVSRMDAATCKCDTKPKAYNGAMAPLDEQLSLHFRGPLALKQFAVYYPSSSAQGKRKAKRATHLQKHARNDRKHGHGHRKPHRKAASGNMVRTAYYDSKKGTADGLVFMNHKGGDGSGVFDHCWGNSLSYMSPNCKSGSAKPQILSDITMPSNTEFVIFSDEKCDGDCGYSRPGIPAHRGFDGKNKIFMFEFQMPRDTSGSFNQNMPSIWALNAKIPRTAQYGSCSCWGSGCGEFDMFEVLEDAHDYVKSHYHAAQGAVSGNKGGGGAPDYFKRPYDKTIKAAAIFDERGTVTVKILDDAVQFGRALDPKVLGENARPSGKISTYNVPK